MKKLLCLLLALSMLFAFAACKTNEPVEDPADTSSEEPSQSTQPSTDEPVTVENPIGYFSMSFSDAEGTKSLTAYDNEDGTAYVEYVGNEKKVGYLDVAVLHNLTAALEATALPSLNAKSEYTDGDAYASMYVQYVDGTYLTADFGGTIPQEFADGYAAMDAYFQTLTAELPAYVPQPMISEGVNEEVLAAMMEILNTSGMEGLDTLAISDVPMDENFGDTTGLSEKDDVLNGTLCSAMMMTTPYSLVIVTVDEADDMDDVCEDFARSLDWRKWVCVAPSNALIAQKGNMVLCLMGSDSLYQQTADAAAAAGWTTVQTLENPDL